MSDCQIVRLSVNELSPDAKKESESTKGAALGNGRETLSSLDNPQLNQIIVSQSLPKNETTSDLRRGLTLRETKSVTKIEPFKFNSDSRRSPGKRIRIAIDVQRFDSKETRLSAPSLPQVRARNRKEFWNELQT